MCSILVFFFRPQSLVFSFLPTTDLTTAVSVSCRALRDAAEHPVCWAGRSVAVSRFLLYSATTLHDPQVTACTPRWRALAHLSLSCGKALTDDAVFAVAGACPLLQSLSLDRCVTMTDAALYSLATGCRALQILNLTFLHKVTDLGLAQLAAGCPRLEALSLAYCVNLTDASLEQLGKCCPRLRKLWLRYCVYMSDHGLHQAYLGCSRLHVSAFHTEGCPKVSPRILTLFAQRVATALESGDDSLQRSYSQSVISVGSDTSVSQSSTSSTSSSVQRV